MSARMLAVLVALLILIGGGAAYYYQQQGVTATVQSLGKPLLPSIKAADISSIALREGADTLTLTRKDGRWILVERGDFPADPQKIREFVLKVLELKIGQNEPVAAADRARLQLAEHGKDGAATELQFKGADGKVLGTLLIGKKYFKGAAPDNIEAAPGDGRFVMLPGVTDRVYIVSDPLPQATAKSASWIITDGIAIQNPGSIEMRFRDGERWRVFREGKQGPWKLDPLKAGEKAEQSRLSSVAYGLYELKIADVAPLGITPADSGLDTPVTLIATGEEGARFTIKLGKLRKTDLYASIVMDDAPADKPRVPAKDEKPEDKAKIDKEYSEFLAKRSARYAREKSLSGYTVLLSMRSLTDILKRRDELLDKKPEPAKKK